MDAQELADLRQSVLMAAVLHDVDVVPGDSGVVLPGLPDLALGWTDLADAVHPLEPPSDAGAARLACWLRQARCLADLPAGGVAALLRPVALPPGHELHPGRDWVQMRVPGGLLDVGAGLLGLNPAQPDRIEIVPATVVAAVGTDVTALWPAARSYAERMGTVAAARLTRDPDGPLRPMGDSDVLTLLSAVSFRSALAQADGVGMRGVAAPMRHRGWTDPDHLDSAFAPAAAAATDPVERGLELAVLVTTDGVHAAINGMTASDFALRDARTRRREDSSAARSGQPLRAVRYRSS